MRGLRRNSLRQAHHAAFRRQNGYRKRYGCSSIYGGSAPTCPYTTNKEGHGPAWANSLFEDNAEFGFGINLAYLQRRNKVTDLLNQVLEIGTAKMKVAAKLWLDNKFDAEGSKKAAQAVKTEIIENARGKVRPIANELAKWKTA